MFYDRDFLKQLDSVKNKIIYARLTSLTFSELPIESIEGKVTGGSISLDGNSSSRRTCNLSLVAQDVNINQFYWGLTHKFKVEIGVNNNINSKYPDIIWFNEGKFVITNFNISLNANNYSITINGKDKMSLINGDLGGSLFAQTDFGNIESYESFYEKVSFLDPTTYTANTYYTRRENPNYNPSKDNDNDKYIYTLSLSKYNKNETYFIPSSIYKVEPLPIKTIIREAIHTYAKEPYFNIVINDLDDYGGELLEYRGDTPLYMIFNPETQEYVSMTLDGNKTCTYKGQANTKIKNIQDDNAFYKRITSLDGTVPDPVPITFPNSHYPNTEYFLSKIEYGDTPGYYRTELIYSGELILNVGEPLTSMLDKIKTMLGDFEYFYDVDGRFVWQRQKVYENKSWNNIIETEDKDILIENAAYSSAVSYNFTNNNIITVFNNTPNLINLRNDFSIWGNRKGVNGTDIPIHLRFAIDKKPTYYKSWGTDGTDGLCYHSSQESYEETINAIIENYNIQIAAIEQQKQNVLNEIDTYVKKPNPNGLPEQWWDVLDWAEKYKILSGHYPTGTLREYASITSHFNPNDYFPEPDIGKQYYHCNSSSRPVGTYAGNGSLIGANGGSFGLYNNYYGSALSVFDVNQDGTLGYYGHGSNCSHAYSHFIDNYTTCRTVSYIYNPVFPQADIEAFEQQIQELKERQQQAKTEEIGKHIICDWREIIYQMAQDYYKHNQEDNFFSTLMAINGQKSNGEFYYPNGNTGYEQYYADIAGFWRDLYDQDPELEYGSWGGYYTETIQWTEGNNLDFVKEKVWVPFELKDTIFESKYYLPEEKKKYSNDNIIEIISKIEHTKINLVSNLPTGSNNNIFSVSWNLQSSSEMVSLNQLDGFEIYRSFYPSSGFSKISVNNTFISSQRYVENQVKRNTILGNEETLTLYYRVRGYKTIGTNTKVYTQWSNRCALVFATIKDIDNNGDVIESSVHVEQVERYTYGFSESVDQMPMTDFKTYKSNFNDSRKYWSKQIYEHPETLNFWFDFLDSDSELAQFAVPVVGDRSKSVNDSKITSIYFKETPTVIFEKPNETILEREPGYTYFKINSAMENLFKISAQGKSAKDVLDEYIYKYSYCIESISITCLPIYYLEPNTRIFVYDENSKINGEYIVTKITLPLTYNGTMSITANRAVSRLY